MELREKSMLDLIKGYIELKQQDQAKLEYYVARDCFDVELDIFGKILKFLIITTFIVVAISLLIVPFAIFCNL